MAILVGLITLLSPAQGWGNIPFDQGHELTEPEPSLAPGPAISPMTSQVNALSQDLTNRYSEYLHGTITRAQLANYCQSLDPISTALAAFLQNYAAISASVGVVGSGQTAAPGVGAGMGVGSSSSGLNGWGGHSKGYSRTITVEIGGSNTQTNPTGEAGAGQTYTCPCCGETFNDRASYDAHVNRCCPESGSTQFHTPFIGQL